MVEGAAIRYHIPVVICEQIARWIVFAEALTLPLCPDLAPLFWRICKTLNSVGVFVSLALALLLAQGRFLDRPVWFQQHTDLVDKLGF